VQKTKRPYGLLPVRPETHKRAKLAATMAGTSLYRFVDAIVTEYLERNADPAPGKDGE